MISRAALIFALLLTLSIGAYAQESSSSRDFHFSQECAPADSQITLSLAGDILIHDALYQSAMTNSERFYSLFKKMQPLFSRADFSYANLEGPVALGIDRDGRDHGDVGFTYDLDIYSGTNFSFNYHPHILQDLKRVGLDLMGTSNNHSLDRGSIGIDRSIDAFRENGLPFVGSRRSNERNAPAYTLTRVKDFQIAWIACTEMTNGIPDRKGQLLLCNQHKTQIAQLIQELAGRSDIDAVIVTPHWGEEYRTSPTSAQKSSGRLFLEAGATAIVGSHPHVLQAWEKYMTRDGRETLIVYSLGNLLAFQAGLAKKAAAVVYLGLKKKTQGKAWVFGARYTPTFRDGFEVFPTNSAEVLKHTQSFFGVQNRRQPSQVLWSESCL